MKCIDCNSDVEGKSLRCPKCKRLHINKLESKRRKRPDVAKKVYEYNKEYQKKHRKKEWSEKYYKIHKEQCNERSKKWRKNNRKKTYQISYKSYLKRANDFDIIPYHYSLYKNQLDNEELLKTLQLLKKIQEKLEI